MTLHRGDPIDLDASNNGATPKGRRLGQTAGLLSKITGGVVGTGVLVDGMAAVVSGSGAGMSYNVRACSIVAKHSDANGPTISALDATENITEADAASPGGTSLAAPGSNSRRDVIYAVQDLVTADGGSGTSNAFRVGVRKGLEAASPATPSVTDIPGAVPLAYATVTAGSTTTAGLVFTQLHSWRTANGGIAPSAKGSRFGRVWDGTREALVTLGMIVRGQTDTVKAATYQQVGRQTVTSDGTGVITVNLEQTFGTTVLGAVAISVGATYPLTIVWTGSTTSTLTMRVFRNDTDTWFGSQPVDLCFVAWGY